MLFVKLHKHAIHKVQRLSTLRKRRCEIYRSSFLEAPKRSSLTKEGDPQQQQQQYYHQRNNKNYTRIVCMSDTHGKHNDIPYLPNGDVLIHCGDITKYGEIESVQSLSQYFCNHTQQQQIGENGSGGANGTFQKIICIAGNHDMTFHSDYYEQTWSRHLFNHSSSLSSSSSSYDPLETKEALQYCTYLEDSSTTLLPRQQQCQQQRQQEEYYDSSLPEFLSTKNNNNSNDIMVYGSPWTPKHFNWAFNLKRGEPLQEIWSQIPSSTDVLVTHGPPKGRGDMTLHSGHFGCVDLLQEIQLRVKPRLHIYGHIHEGYGTSYDGQTLYVNASNLDIGYEAINPCIVIDLPNDITQPAMIVEPQLQYSNIHDVNDFVAWLYQNGYYMVAQAMMEQQQQQQQQSKRSYVIKSQDEIVKEEVFDPHSSLSSSSSLQLLLPNNLFSGTAYQSLCDQFGWTSRRKHNLAKQELRTALCRLYAECFH